MSDAPIGIVPCGATLVIIAGRFDLSVGAIFALAGVVARWLAAHVGAVAGLAGGILLVVVVGIFNSLLVTEMRVNSFLATPASSLIFRGIAVAITGGFLVAATAVVFRAPGQHAIGGVNYSTIFLRGDRDHPSIRTLENHLRPLDPRGRRLLRGGAARIGQPEIPGWSVATRYPGQN